ncbi:hypothetical protein B0H67DRAFT_685740 [Lasiosphaeris hirsuta]|uniref:Tudor domain-containing protein n=1 Tax=Lasiosphaeris hirsuta TaxID=260670 RepID=A0AA40DNK7_9PEZI|nr:hypothetical protein B0H67DRAFT_685740 [Lasiosphaeris hirsuta]
MSAQLETERREYESQLELVSTSLKDDPENAELRNLREELVQMIQLLDDALAELQPKASPPPPASKSAPKRPASPPPAEEQPKWSRENHPAFKKAAGSSTTPAAGAAAPTAAGDEPEQPVVYQVNDNVMAKWLSGDKGFYAARITSVTGSSTAPIYTVRFKSYDTVETLRGKDIRPVAAAKRKADAVSSSTTTTAPAAPAVERGLEGGVVASAAADLYPQAAKLGEKEGDKEKPKFKKIKANKELEAGKNKWQEFNAKGKHGKTAKKDSMFRTPEGFKGRVGFTGSGQAMRKDPTRSRHVYQPNEDVD